MFDGRELEIKGRQHKDNSRSLWELSEVKLQGVTGFEGEMSTDTGGEKAVVQFAVIVAADRMLLHVPEVLLIHKAGMLPKKPRPQSVLT